MDHYLVAQNGEAARGRDVAVSETLARISDTATSARVLLLHVADEKFSYHLTTMPKASSASSSSKAALSISLDQARALPRLASHALSDGELVVPGSR